MHIWIGKGSLAASGAEIGKAREVIFDHLEVSIKAESENRVCVFGVDKVVFYHFLWKAEVFFFEV